MLTPEQKLSYRSKGVIDEILMEFLEDTKIHDKETMAESLNLDDETAKAVSSFIQNGSLAIIQEALSNPAFIPAHLSGFISLGVWLGVTGRAKVGERKLDS